MPSIHGQLLEVAADLSPELASVIEGNGSLRLIRSASESLPVRLCRAVTGQQLSVKAAHAIWNRVQHAAGDNDLMTHIARSTPEALRACGLSMAKAKTLQAIAEAEHAGNLDEANLHTLEASERAQALTQIWGVGQWTADMVGIFYFGDPDIWPDGDVTARKMLSRLTSPRRKTVLTAARFAPFRSYLALHMWRHAAAKPD
ncbi:MAG: DNA-3-methyladenine glycosylase 2 family protein [Myxococcota bacterium]